MFSNVSAQSSQSPVSLEDIVNQVVSLLTLHDRTTLAQGSSGGYDHMTAAMPTKALGGIKLSNGPVGVNANDYSQTETSFGSGLIIASTWNQSLQQKVGQTIGKECLAKGIQMLEGPGVNILRDLAGGRTFEYYSEDPYLVANTAVPYIKGVQSEGVAATVKHFMANSEETNRAFMTVNMSERAMHEIYLPAYQAAAEQADVWSVMTTASRVNGSFVCDNRYLMTNLLKDDFGMRGIVYTDWSSARTNVIAKKAGLDLSMPFHASTWFTSLEDLIRSGQLDKSTVADSAQRLVRVAALTKSLITTDQVDAAGYTAADRQTGEVNTTANQAVARQVADEGIVLLKNQNSLLPLNKSSISSMAVIGKYADYNFFQSGAYGSAYTNPPYSVTNLQGLRNALGSSVTLKTPAYNESNLSKTISDAVAAAKSAQYAVVFAGVNSTAYTDSNPTDTEGADRNDMSFPAAQQQLIAAVAAANPNTIVVLNGSVVDVSGWVDSIPSVLQTFYPGMEVGNAVADILFGSVNPSGKLTFTWPKQYSDTCAYVPASGNDINDVSQKQNDVNDTEGVYVGYRYNDKKNITPQFAFGHGLSYSTFSYSNLRFNQSSMGPDDTLSCSVDVKNVSSVAGEETPQLYIHQDNPSIDRPLKELKGYQKISLGPGETKTVSFSIDKSALSYWDVNTHSYKADAGDYEAWVGSASDDIRLKGTFTLTGTTSPDPDYTVVQAESAASATGTVTGANNEVDGTVTSFLKLNGADSQARWNVTVPQAGKYSIIFRYSNNGYSGNVTASYGPNKTTALSVNGQSAGSYDFQNTRWANVYNYDSIDVSLNAGENTIALNATASTPGLILDKMIVQKINRILPEPADCAPDGEDAPPSQETPAGTEFQVENNTALNGGAVAAQKPNYTGTGYVDLPSSGNSVTFNIYVDTFSPYRLNMYYSNGNADPAPCDIYINGVLAGSYTFAPTGGWSKWKQEQSPLVGINNGINSVKIVAKAGCVSLDRVVLTGGMDYIDKDPPQVISTSPSGGGTLSGDASPVTVYFSEQIKAGTGTAAFTADGQAAVPCTLVVSGTSAVLTPTSFLQPGTAYTLTLPKGSVTDLSGNSPAGDITFDFKTPQMQTTAVTDPRVVVAGSGWQQSGGGLVSSASGDALTFWADGTDVILTMPTGPDKGIATVYVDEQQKRTGAGTSIDLYSDSAGTRTFDTGTLKNGIHRVRVVVSGTKSAGTGTAAGAVSVAVAGTLIAAPLPRTGWSATAFADAPEYNFTFDGNLGTRWSSCVSQTSGQWYTLDLGKATELSALLLYCATDDYIRGYQVYVSADGSSWGSPVCTGAGSPGDYVTIEFPVTTCRYVKIVQTGSVSKWWSINEMYAFDKPYSDTESPTTPEYVYFTGYNGQILLGWPAASDNVGVTGYVVYRDGVKIGRTAQTSFLDADGLQDRSYAYSVRAMDGSGNLSVLSDPVSAVFDPDTQSIPTGGWSATSNPVSTVNSTTSAAFDGNAATRWTSGVKMAVGQWFTLDMGASYVFNRVVMDGNSTDYPGGFDIYVSDDGQSWSGPVYSGAGAAGSTTADFSRQKARYVKIVITRLGNDKWWSIFEMNVFNAGAGQTNKTALQKAVNATLGFVSDDYAVGNWNTFTAVRDAANAVLADAGAAQSDVDTALNVLNAAVGALSIPAAADKSGLITAIQSAASLNKERYTPGSWATLEEALASARQEEMDDEATQPHVDATASGLGDAIKALVWRPFLEDMTPGTTAAGLREKLIGDRTIAAGAQVTIEDASGNALPDASVVGTGARVSADGQSLTVVLWGDLNGNGQVDASDLLILKRSILQMVSLSGAFAKAANVDGDASGALDATDLLALKRAILGIQPLGPSGSA